MLLDLRKINGPLFLDTTESGLSLRRMSSSSIYTYNYVFAFLRNIISSVKEGDYVVFIIDNDLFGDFQAIHFFLKKINVNSELLLTPRIGTDDLFNSARKGGWDNFTIDKIIQKYEKDFSLKTIVLGLKLYFISEFRSESLAGLFSYDLLQKYIRKAEKIIDVFSEGDSDDLELQTMIRNCSPKYYLHPSLLVQLIWSKKTSQTLKSLLIRKLFL